MLLARRVTGDATRDICSNFSCDLRARGRELRDALASLLFVLL